MNKPSALKTIIASIILFAVMNILASCDGFDRNKNDETGSMETEESAGQYDTLSNDHAEGDADTGFDTPNSNNRGTGAGRNTTSGTGTGNNTSTGGNTGSQTEAGNSGNSTGYGDSNSPIENSGTPAVNSGRPIQSGGSSGSGMGTGTGSTGNNSKVTRPEDQRN
jgi:hypothetical protein